MITIHSLKEAHASEQGPHPDYEGRRALLVEDNRINQKVGAALLRKLGFEVDVVGNGVEAVRAATDCRYDVVLMDCQMPRMDGLEATRCIRALPDASSSAPIIAMTAHAMEADRQKCLDAGMNDYLSKPVSLDKLRKVVTEHVDLG
jgi:CheY-like chemotaxis protein